MTSAFSLLTLYSLVMALSCLAQGPSSSWNKNTDNNPIVKVVFEDKVGLRWAAEDALSFGPKSFQLSRAENGTKEQTFNQTVYVEWRSRRELGNCTISGTMPANKDIPKENLKYNQVFELQSKSGVAPVKSVGPFGVNDKLKIACDVRPHSYGWGAEWEK